MSKKLALYFLVVMVVSGCATSYQPLGYTGGYSTLQIEERIFRVTFQGNGYARRDRVIDFSLLKAAELTLEKGGSYFVILNNDKSSSTAIIPGMTNTTGTVAPTLGGGYRYSGRSYSSAPILIRRHTAEILIQIFDEKPRGNFISYSAVLIRDQLKSKYGLK